VVVAQLREAEVEGGDQEARYDPSAKAVDGFADEIRQHIWSVNRQDARSNRAAHAAQMLLQRSTIPEPFCAEVPSAVVQARQ
jgi:hypothetical protein